METHADRLTATLAHLLPDDVKVTNAQGLIVIERGSARAMFRPGTEADRRRTITLAQAREALAQAADSLAREIPKYRQDFRADSWDLVNLLKARATP